MNYLDGFTKLQYEAVREFSTQLLHNNIGDVYVSPKALFHGKMYSFLKDNQCLGAFIGSSNLGSFTGTSQNLIEADVLFEDNNGLFVNDSIIKLTKTLGESLSTAAELTNFKEPSNALLDGYEHVEKLSDADRINFLAQKTSNQVVIPLKTEPKSNLNTYFGAGKVKDHEFWKTALVHLKLRSNNNY